MPETKTFKNKYIVNAQITFNDICGGPDEIESEMLIIECDEDVETLESLIVSTFDEYIGTDIGYDTYEDYLENEHELQDLDKTVMPTDELYEEICCLRNNGKSLCEAIEYLRIKFGWKINEIVPDITVAITD